jgi:transcription antitermination factor NusG
MNKEWYALYTKGRHEKFVENKLNGKDIEAYTPKVTLRRKWSDRIKLIDEPLFKSYCFAKFSIDDKKKVITQAGVVNVVHFKDQYIPVPEEVINSLKILTQNKVKLDPCPYIKEGQRVSIKKGPLKGVEGIVIEKRNHNTSLVISIDAIASSVQCVVDMDFIESA